MSAVFGHQLLPEPSPRARDAIIRGSWDDFLRAHLEDDWRPAEWQPEHWLFVGDVDNPTTRVYACSVVGCTLTSDTRDGPCTSCRKILRESNNDHEAAAAAVAARRAPPVQVGKPKQDCLVERGGDRCQRAMFASGLCETHQVHWRLTYSPRGMTIEEFLTSGIPNPLARIGACDVVACGRERSNKQTLLCPAHRANYRSLVAKTPDGTLRLGEADFASRVAPILPRGAFSLIPLPERLRLEYLVAIQADERAGYLIDPILIRRLIPDILAAGLSFTDDGFLERAVTLAQAKMTARAAFIRRAVATLRHLRARFSGVDPTAGDVWDSYLIGLRTDQQVKGRASAHNADKFIARRRPLDFRPIRQAWLRELVKAWARENDPTTIEVTAAIKGFTVVSDVLSSRSGGDDPTTASARDIQRFVDRLHTLEREDGEQYSKGHVSNLLTSVRRILHYLHDSPHADELQRKFVITPEHRILGRAASKAEEPGRALPNRVVETLHRSIPSLPIGKAQTGSFVTAETLRLMHQTALRLLFDTGRRPNEICSLKAGCITAHPSGSDPNGVEYTLTYDNHKGKRYGRVLPIGVDTAEAVLAWEDHLTTLELPQRFTKWLFPSPSAGRADAKSHLTTSGLQRALDRLVQSVVQLESDIPDRENGGYVLFTGQIIPYSFRHSYTQRHADAGVAQDTLQDLMDHLSPNTTAGYYRVSAKRKREAVARLSAATVNNRGEPAPLASEAAYELGQIPVPWGGCSNPTNVKAGGKACPIRFRCVGCSFYRPDPSYIPAIEEHLVSLRMSLHMVELAGFAAPWVIQEQREEITAYDEMLAGMKQQIEAMSEDDQNALEDASVAMRKLRASRPLLPLSVRGGSAA